MNKHATSEEKKQTGLFSDEEEIMPPPKTTETSTTDTLAGMMEKVQLDKEPAQGAGRGASPNRKPGATPEPSPGRGRGRGAAAPKTDSEETKRHQQEETLVRQYRAGYQHSLMKFESQRAKLDLLQDVLRRPYSVPMLSLIHI